MRRLTAFAAPLLALALWAGAAPAATVFHETFQDDIIRAFNGIPYDNVPVDQARTVTGFVEPFSDPVSSTSGNIVFGPLNQRPLAVAKRSFCLSGCAQFIDNSGYVLRSQPSPLLLEAGQDYRLSVTLRLINGVAPQVPSSRMGLRALQGGQQRAAEGFDLFNSGSFATYALDLDGTNLINAPVQFEISFGPRVSGGSGIYIEEILFETVAAPVPVPASGALLVGGIAAVVGLRRRAAQPSASSAASASGTRV